MNIIDHSAAVTLGKERAAKRTWPILSVLLVCLACGAGGCADRYGAYPAYGRGYYAGGPGYGPGPGYAYPGYGYPGGSVTIEVGDRPYYTRGPGYYVGRAYYVWKPGHWAQRHGRKVWIHGHYVLRR
jgi:hypothetical protein